MASPETQQLQQEAAVTMQMQKQKQEVVVSDPVQRGTLYVGDLNPETTESDLMQKFGVMGPIHSVRICRSNDTAKSLRYGYVNFYYHSHESKAMACLNHADLNGKPMRIMWSQRNPISRKCGIGNLFVKNLDPSIDSTQLQAIFCHYGTILSCKVAEENGKSKGFGFVQFDSEDSAIAACTALNDTMLAGKKLHVSKFVKKSDRVAASDDLKFTNLYVKNLVEDVTEDFLKDMFSVYGKVCNVSIMKDHNGRSRGFGFLNFESPEEAKTAVHALNGALLGSKILFVGRAQKKAERTEILKREFKDKYNCHIDKWKASNLYVKNLNGSIDDKKLQGLFCGFGRIISAKVMRHDDGISKGFGFVCYSSPEEAKKALDTLNGINYEEKTLYVAIAQRKEDGCRQLHKYYAQNQPQSLYASNCNVVPSPTQFCPLYFNSPPCPPSFPLLRQPILYQHFGTNVGVQYPFAAHNHQQNFFTYIPRRQPLLGNPRDWVYRRHPMTYATSSVCTQDLSRGNPAVQKAGFRKKGNKRSGPAESYSRVSASTRGLAAATSPVHSKKKIGDLLHPLVENLQPERAGKITGMLLEMNNSDLIKMLKSPNSLSVQVDKAVQVLKEANALTSADGVDLPKSARCLSY